MPIIIKQNEGVAIKVISYLKGTVIHKTDSSVMLQGGNIGYEVLIPTNRLEYYTLNGEYDFYISTQVREDAITLYGFLSWEERNLFLILLNVSGIGPKAALAIVGQVSLAGLYQAVLNENITLLTNVPGIGKKTAQRLILELKDRLPKEFQATTDDFTGIITENTLPSNQDDIFAVLLSFGYKESEIRNVYKQLKPMIGKEEEQTIIKYALKLLAKI